MAAELAIVPQQAPDLTAIERVIVAGDLSKLTPDERWNYYKGVCQSVGLNPFTQPFLYITLSGKLVLYATKGAADQLRDNHHISISQPKVDLSDGLCIVTVTATDRSGRTDSDLGIVPCENLRGDAKANAILKAVTKAKRRVTLSMCGLGMLDETEVETIPSARPAGIEAIPAHALTGASTGPTIIDPRTSAEDAAVIQAEAVAGWSGQAPVDGPPPVSPRRQRRIASLQAGIAKARGLGIDVDDVDPAALSDDAILELVRSLGQMVTDVEAALAAQAEAPAAPDPKPVSAMDPDWTPDDGDDAPF